jgi:ABC-type bacteriocin/lantibiotic exporter with double-glycine peptidase domain
MRAISWSCFTRFICLLGVLNAHMASAIAEDTWIANKHKLSLIKQEDQISCGPVSVSMVLSYLGKDAGIGPLKTKCGSRILEAGRVKVGMTMPDGIKKGFEGYDCNCEIKNDASFEDVKSAINSNRPPILLVRSGDTTWHYVVVVGFGTAGQQRYYHIADPGTGTIRKIHEGKLGRGWIFGGSYDGDEVTLDPDLPRKVVELAKVRGNTMFLPSR